LLLGISIRMFEMGPLQPILYPYKFYEKIGQERGESYDRLVVLEVPTGAGTGEVLLGNVDAIQFEFYGITHQKRMVNGFIARAPLENFWYIHIDDPMLSWLGQRRLLEGDTVRAQLQDRIFNWPIGYIVIHQDYIRRQYVDPLEITGYLNALPDLVCPWIVEGEAIVYRTRAHPDGCPSLIPPEVEPGVYMIDIGTPGDERYLGWGWHWPETVAGITLRWSGDYPQTYTYLDLPPGDYDVSLSTQAFWEPRQIRLWVNDQPLGDFVTVPIERLEEYTFHLPAEVVGNGKHLTLTLEYDTWRVPVQVGQSQDQRQLAVAVDWLRFTRQTTAASDQ